MYVRISNRTEPSFNHTVSFIPSAKEKLFSGIKMLCSSSYEFGRLSFEKGPMLLGSEKSNIAWQTPWEL